MYQPNPNQDLLNYISDASKDAMGFRDRTDYSHMSRAELEVICRQYEEMVVDRIEEDMRQEEAAREAFRKTLAKTIEAGARDVKTALRWLVEAEVDEIFDPWHRQEVENFFFRQGLSIFDLGRYTSILLD